MWTYYWLSLFLINPLMLKKPVSWQAHRLCGPGALHQEVLWFEHFSRFRQLSFSFGQCVSTFERHITNHFLSESTKLENPVDGWAGCKVSSSKGWSVTDHKTEAQGSSTPNTYGVRWGAGHGEGHTVGKQQSKLRPPGRFPTSGLKVTGGWNLPGPQAFQKISSW